MRTKHKFLRTTGFWLLRYLQIQLFINLISLPLLIAWGLPVSLASTLGNLLFNPFLTAFLFVSSLIFFSELLHVPNGYLIVLLEKISNAWLWCMDCASDSFLTSFSHVPLVIQLIIPILVLCVLLSKKTNTLFASTSIFAAITCIMFTYNYYTFPLPSHRTIPCNKGEVTILNNNNTITVIDPGYIGQKESAPSWVQYTLIPQLIETTGRNKIDNFIILQPNYFTLHALQHMCFLTNITNLFLPKPDYPTEKKWWRTYQIMRHTAKKTNTQVITLSRKKTTDTTRRVFSYEPLDTTLSHTGVAYPALSISALIDNDTITLYPAKYKKGKKTGLKRQSTQQIVTESASK